MYSKTLLVPWESFSSTIFSSICTQSYLKCMYVNHLCCVWKLHVWLRTWEVTSGPGIAGIKTVSRQRREKQPGWKWICVNITYMSCRNLYGYFSPGGSPGIWLLVLQLLSQFLEFSHTSWQHIKNERSFIC